MSSGNSITWAPRSRKYGTAENATACRAKSAASSSSVTSTMRMARPTVMKRPNSTGPDVSTMKANVMGIAAQSTDTSNVV